METLLFVTRLFEIKAVCFRLRFVQRRTGADQTNGGRRAGADAEIGAGGFKTNAKKSKTRCVALIMIIHVRKPLVFFFF